METGNKQREFCVFCLQKICHRFVACSHQSCSEGFFGLLKVEAWSWVEAANFLLSIITVCQEACASYLMKRIAFPYLGILTPFVQLWRSSVFSCLAHPQERTNNHRALGTQPDLLFQVFPDIFSLFSLPAVPAIISLDSKGFPSLFQGEGFSYNTESLWSWESFCLIQQVHLQSWLYCGFLQPLNYKATWMLVVWWGMALGARGVWLLPNSPKLFFLFYTPGSAHTSPLSVGYKNVLTG